MYEGCVNLMKQKNKKNNKKDNIKKRSFIIILLCCLVTVSIDVHAADYYTESNFQYTIEADSVHIHSYFGSDEAVLIPEMIAGKTVTTIDDYAFSNCKSAKTITIPDTIVSIGTNAFAGATALEEIITQSKQADMELGNDIKIIEDYPKYAKPDKSLEEESQNGKNVESPIGSNSDDTIQNDKIEMQADAGTADDSAQSSQMGIYTADNKKLITVDNTNNLIEIDTNGNVTVLDRDLTYKLIEQDNGKVSIEDEKGRNVTVAPTGSVSITDHIENSRFSSVGLMAVGLFAAMMCIGAAIRHKLKKPSGKGVK